MFTFLLQFNAYLKGSALPESLLVTYLTPYGSALASVSLHMSVCIYIWFGGLLYGGGMTRDSFGVSDAITIAFFFQKVYPNLCFILLNTHKELVFYIFSFLHVVGHATDDKESNSSKVLGFIDGTITSHIPFHPLEEVDHGAFHQ